MEKEIVNTSDIISDHTKINLVDWKKEAYWQMQVNIKKLHPDAKMPIYAHESDACMDIVAVDFEFNDTIDTWIYYTGLAVEIPKGYVMLIMPRSSSTNTEMILQNTPSVIDSGFRGEITLRFKVRTATAVINSLVNKSYVRNNEDLYCAPYEIGDKIAQCMIIPYPKIQWNEVNELTSSDRGENGYGSTGR